MSGSGAVTGVVTVGGAATPQPAAPAGRERAGLTYWARLVGPPLAFLGYALYLAWPLLVDPGRGLFPGIQGADQVCAQWFLAHTAHAVVHLQDPFATRQLNAPAGVDLAAQVSMVGVGVPLTPVTLLAGAPVSYLLLVVAGMAGTATAWYWLLSGKLGLHWLAGTVGALCCAFTPQLMIEATGRNHVTLQVLIPVIIWRVVQLRVPEHWVRRAVVLGLLITWQALIGEEILLLTAIGLAVFLGTYLALRPGLARLAGRYLRGLAVAAGVAVPLLAYPLWRQFFGAQHFTGFPLDLQFYTGWISRYLGVPPAWANRLPGSPSWMAWWGIVDPATLGLPLAVLLLGTLLVLRRQPVVVAAFVTVLAFAVLSQGERIRLGPHGSYPGPWRLVSHLPVASAVVPYRLSLGAVAAAGVVVAYAVDATVRAVRDSLRRPRVRVHRIRPVLVAAAALFVVGTLIGLSALQLRPAPLPVVKGTAIPRFISSGAWQRYVAGGRTLVSVPPASSVWLDGQRWSIATVVGFAIPDGYFLGPDSTGRKALFGAPHTWASDYLNAVADTGLVPATGPADRDRFLADLRRWRAGLLVLNDAQPKRAALQLAVQRLLGPGQPVEDVWLWDVRSLT